MSGYIHRTDKRHADCVKALRALGCSVVSLAAVGRGCPDLILGFARRTYLIELKTDNAKPRKNQIDWHSAWRGTPVILLNIPTNASPGEVMVLCRAMLKILEKENEAA
jgi:Holliday junction resolvase